MAVPPFDVAAAHRRFAIELNNLAWDLVEATSRTSEDTDRMLHAAHAALYHWSEVGTPLNRQRALCLLATAYAAASRPEEALRYAEECLRINETNPEGQTPFDRATAHGCLASAYSLANQTAEARHHHSLALEAAVEFTDPEDHPLFDRLYPAPASA